MKLCYRSCDVADCEHRAVFHIHEGEVIHHLCESHAAEYLRVPSIVPRDDVPPITLSLELVRENGNLRKEFVVLPSVVLSIDHQTAARFCVIPVAVSDQSLTIAAPAPLDESARSCLEFVSNQRISIVYATERSIRAAIAQAYSTKS